MVYQDGSEYKGQIEAGARHGYGYFNWPKSANSVEADEPKSSSSKKQTDHRYVGHWLNNQMHGSGKFLHASGFLYFDTFCNN